MKVEVNDKYIPCIENQDRFLILYGGGGSGKSVFAAFKIILRTVTEKPHKFLVLRKVATTVRLSVFEEIKAAIEDNALSSEFKINKSEYSFYHLFTGNSIHCMGLDEPEKIKSIKGITSMWMEEATEFEENDLDQLDLRIRGIKDNYVQYILTFNPIDENHWLRKRFCTKKIEGVTVIHSTYLDNFFLSSQDKQRLHDLKERNPLYYDVYCLGLWGVVDKSNKFLYSFNSDSQINKGSKIIPQLPVWFTFDFNIDPMTVSVGQRINLKTVQFYHSIQLNDSDIYAMTDRLKADYNGLTWQVTGDASGNNRTGMVRGKTSYWKTIKEELRLKDHQIHVRNQNIGLIESRVLCNAVNKTCQVLFDEQGCEPLINDCKFAKVDEKGVLIKDRKIQKNDFLDGYRYLIDINYHDILDKPKKYN